MPTDPLTGSRYPSSTAAPNVPQDIQNAVLDLAGNTVPRFASTTARDAAYSAYTAAGGTLPNGRICWTDDAGTWQRVSGAWTRRWPTPGTTSVNYATGWLNYSGYYQPAVRVASEGIVTMRGMFARTGANLSLPVGGAITLGTIDAAATPVWNVSAIVAVGLGPSQDSYPARLFIPAGTTTVQVIGMNTGAGTFYQNLGFVSCDGVSWYL